MIVGTRCGAESLYSHSHNSTHVPRVHHQASPLAIYDHDILVAQYPLDSLGRSSVLSPGIQASPVVSQSHSHTLPLLLFQAGNSEISRVYGPLSCSSFRIQLAAFHTVTSVLWLFRSPITFSAVSNTRTTSSPIPPWARGCSLVRMQWAKSSHSRCRGSI